MSYLKTDLLKHLKKLYYELLTFLLIFEGQKLLQAICKNDWQICGFLVKDKHKN